MNNPGILITLKDATGADCEFDVDALRAQLLACGLLGDGVMRQQFERFLWKAIATRQRQKDYFEARNAKKSDSEKFAYMKMAMAAEKELDALIHYYRLYLPSIPDQKKP